MLGDADQRELLEIAASSIRHGLEQGRPLPVEAGGYTGALAEPGACFVSLHRNGGLRGCIGTLEPHRALALDAAENAYAAAFCDPRFPPLRSDEWGGLELEVSVLTPAEPLPASSEAELIARLRPGEDGLVLNERGQRATFLPAVWANLPEPRAFLDHLRLKAGLPPGYWSDTIRFSRYRTESFGRVLDELAREQPG